MPSTSQELHNIISKYFPNAECLDNACIKFLESRGFTLTKQWQWIKPVPSHTERKEETQCIVFLIEEWDFGDIIK